MLMFRDPSKPSGYNESGLLALVDTLSGQQTLSSNRTGNKFGLAPQLQRKADVEINVGNLHVSGFPEGVSTDEIKAMFSPYCMIRDVVMKGTFCFVNTDDPEGAARAKASLQGADLRGRTIKINDAIKKQPAANGVSRTSGMQTYENEEERLATLSRQRRDELGPLPLDPFGKVDISRIRDEKGNMPTPNLFISGYGLGTVEQDIRSLFGSIVEITHLAMKTTFCFVNTPDVQQACLTRDKLTGHIVNGGALRINFAKEQASVRIQNLLAQQPSMVPPPVDYGGMGMNNFSQPPPQMNYGAPPPQMNYGAPPPMMNNYGAPPPPAFAPPPPPPGAGYGMPPPNFQQPPPNFQRPPGM